MSTASSVHLLPMLMTPRCLVYRILAEIENTWNYRRVLEKDLPAQYSLHRESLPQSIMSQQHNCPKPGGGLGKRRSYTASDWRDQHLGSKVLMLTKETDDPCCVWGAREVLNCATGSG